MRMQVAIVGKGIVGLTLGYQLMKCGVHVSFFYGEEDTASLAALGVFASKGLFFAKEPFFSED